MKRRLVHFAMGLCILSGGCSMAANTVHNLDFETSLGMTECWTRDRNRQLARDVWELYLERNGDQEHSKDYADGFQEGFADYVEAGGTGQPPAVPPRRYWKLRYQNPTGYVAIEDWFAGFRTGAAVAQAGGFRTWFTTVPSSLCTPQHADVPVEPVEGARDGFGHTRQQRQQRLDRFTREPMLISETAGPKRL